MRSKRGEIGTELPVVAVVEIVIAIGIVYLFVDTGKAYASQEIYLKQSVANEIGLAIDALFGLKGDAYLEIPGLYRYDIALDNTKVEVKTSGKQEDTSSGTYYFIGPKRNDISTGQKVFRNPVDFSIVKQGNNVFVLDGTQPHKKLGCSRRTERTVKSFMIKTEAIGPHNTALDAVEQGILGVSTKQFISGMDKVDKLLIVLSASAPVQSSSIRIYVPYKSDSAYDISCFILDEIVGKVPVDNYYIVPLDTMRIPKNDPKEALKQNPESIFIEFSLDSSLMNAQSADIASSFIKGIEEYNK